MSSVYVVCWIFLQTFQTYSCIQANSMDPDQTAPRELIWVHSLQKWLLKLQAGDKADDNCCDCVRSSCVRSAMLHASETWPLTKPNLQRLQQNDRAMIRQICNVRPQDIVTTRSNELLVQLGIEDLDLILKERRLRWYGPVERSNGALKTAFDTQVDGKHGPGRHKMTWKQLTERDCREWKLSAINPHDRHSWRSGVRSAMRAASQLSGRGPPGVDVAPVPAC